jgi:hypothetical protein
LGCSSAASGRLEAFAETRSWAATFVVPIPFVGARLVVLIALVGYAVLAVVVSFLVYLVVARSLRLGLARACLGVGPVLLRVRPFGSPTEIRLVPISCFVVPWPPPEEADADGAVAVHIASGERRPFVALSRPQQAVFVVIPLLTALALAVFAQGTALPSLVLHDGTDLFRGALAPRTFAPRRLDAALVFANTHGFGALALRLAPIYALGQLTGLGNLRLLSKEPGGAGSVAAALGPTLLVVPVALGWLVALVGWAVLGWGG